MCRLRAAFFALIVACAASGGIAPRLQAQVPIADYSVRVESGWQERYAVTFSVDSMRGIVAIRGDFYAPDPCGDVSPSARVVDAATIEVQFTRVPPDTNYVCLGMVGRYLVATLIGPLAPRDYRIRVRYTFRRQDGSAMIDTMLTDAKVRISPHR